MKKFILEGIDKQDCASIFGRFGTCEIFVLSRSPQDLYDNIANTYNTDMVYTLTLVDQKRTQTYSLIEYFDGEDYDIDGDCGMVMTIRNEIEAKLSSCESATEGYGE